ncbi:MAG: rRNA maturation RNase YbeY [Alphaproteobacteria bacterium]|nr:rRNA maturation RNase YbeY [Alphaproteobacteria bacterium]
MNAADLIVEDDSWNALKGKTRLINEALTAARDHLGEARPGVIAILLSSDDAIAELNSRFRDREGATNVLSFPAPENTDNHLGDIALAWGVVSREAQTRKIEIADHLRHLVIHGYFHLQGLDHQNDDEAEHMEGLERRALAALGVADPYAAEEKADI